MLIMNCNMTMGYNRFDHVFNPFLANSFEESSHYWDHLNKSTKLMKKTFNLTWLFEFIFLKNK